KERERYFSAGYSYQLATEHGIDDYLKLIQQKPAPQTYFKNGWESRFDNIFLFGWLENNIGYVHFDCFVNPEKSAEVMDEVVQTFKDADAMIVDVRHNSGGNDQVGKVIADRFADDKRLYMVTKIRIGPGYEDFGPPKYWHVEPASPRTFTKPVILLTDRTSVSAAENFTLAMRVLPHVTIVGDTTSGCHADSKGINLPNGWTVTVPFNLFLDPNGFCWEGIGIPPDIRQINTKNDLEAGRDRILELAIDLLKTGGFVYSKNRKLYLIDE
ncbi:MAG: S41 family peptidase, partial [Candidatus Babeliaceae bacterium]|nr:S41 family peptidase [Candidatus Babeliaceae bacterium]